MWYVYMVRCSDGSLYAGVTTDVERRFREHKEGGKIGAKYTRARIPISVVYQECWASRSEAQKREAQLKKLTKAEKETLVKTQAKHNPQKSKQKLD